jgi:perosamine synthetase
MREIKFARPIIDDKEKEAVREVLSGDILVHGPFAKEFESQFAKFTNAPNAISTSSCTASLHLSYFTHKIGLGDEVIVPAQTHVATAHSVELSGATPIFVDAELNTGNIDIDQIESKITDKTKAISIVHFLGMPVDMDRIMEIANKYNLKVIEDCALAVGSKFKGKHVGLFGDTGCFSFYPVKHFTTAEGGMIITNDIIQAKRLEREKAFGVDRTVSERKIPGVYDVNMLGYNYRMNEIQSVIGIEQLKKVPLFLEKRKENYECLENGLKEIKEINLFQSSKNDYESSYYCLNIVLEEELASKRYEIVEYLKKHGVGTSNYYPRPVPDFSYYINKYGDRKNQFPNAAKISYQGIALPVGPHLDLTDMQYIVNKVKESIIKY